MAAEILSVFGGDASKVCLVPSDGGSFEVSLNGQLVFSKLATNRFPELEEIVELIAAKQE